MRRYLVTQGAGPRVWMLHWLEGNELRSVPWPYWSEGDVMGLVWRD